MQPLSKIQNCVEEGRKQKKVPGDIPYPDVVPLYPARACANNGIKAAFSRLRMKTATQPDATSCLNIEAYPSESRLIIFEFAVLDEPWTGRTPSLIKALRGKATLYEEVLLIYHSTYTLSQYVIISTKKVGKEERCESEECDWGKVPGAEYARLSRKQSHGQ
jgi:hypothetical protein